MNINRTLFVYADAPGSPTSVMDATSTRIPIATMGVATAEKWFVVQRTPQIDADPTVWSGAANVQSVAHTIASGIANNARRYGKPTTNKIAYAIFPDLVNGAPIYQPNEVPSIAFLTEGLDQNGEAELENLLVRFLIGPRALVSNGATSYPHSGAVKVDINTIHGDAALADPQYVSVLAQVTPQQPQQPVNPPQPQQPQQPHRYTSAELEQMDTLGKITKLRACYDDITASTPEVKRFIDAFGISANVDWNASVARTMDGYMSPERRAVFNAALASITI